MRNYGIYNMKRFKKIYIEITNNCNLNCDFCIKNKRKNKFITIDEFNIILEKIRDYTDYLISDSCIIDTINFNCDDRPTKCSAKFRYRQQDNDVELEYLDNDTILVKYPQGVKSVTPGQACVLYDGDKCIGGGIIKTVCKNQEKLWYVL